MRVPKVIRRNRAWFAGAVLIMMATACSTSVEIQRATASGDGMNLGLSLKSCNRTYEVSVEEADGVMVHVVDRQSPISLGGEACSDLVEVSLTEPLGTRSLIDASNSNEVEVTYEPWNQQQFSEGEYRAALEAAAECIVAADPTISAHVAESGVGPHLVVNMPDLGDGESDTVNAEYHCTIEHLDPLRR